MPTYKTAHAQIKVMLTALRILIIHPWTDTHFDIEQIFKIYPELVYVGACHTLSESRIVISATQPDAVVMSLDNAADNQTFALALGSTPFKIIFLNETEGDDETQRKGGLPPQTRDIFLSTLAQSLDENFAVDNIDEVLELKKSALMNRNRIALRTPDFVQLVPFDEVLYCSSDGGYTTFHLTDDRKVVTSKPLKDFDEALPMSHFIRTHQSYLVNHHFIDKLFKENYLLLRNGIHIPVAVRKKTEISRLLAR